MNILPTEIHTCIRRYGYIPTVSSEELLYLIQELDPSYSITELAMRYSQWCSKKDTTSVFPDIKRTQLPNYFWMSESPASISRCIYAKNTNAHEISANIGINFVADYDDKYITVNAKDTLPSMIEKLNYDDENPLNLAVIRYDGNSYRYDRNTVTSASQKVVETDNYHEALNYLTTMEPSFSLQKEYTRIQKLYNLKRKPCILDSIIQQLGNSKIYLAASTIADECMLLCINYDNSITLDLGENRRNIYMVITHDPSRGIIEMHTTIDVFEHVIAKLWDGITFEKSLPWLYISKYTTSFTTCII